MAKLFYYLEELNAKTAELSRLSDNEFKEIEAQAKTLFNCIRAELFAERGALNFSAAFVGSSGSIHGFFFPSARIIHKQSGKKLLCVAFCEQLKYNKTHEPHFYKEGFAPLAIFEDENEKYFKLLAHELDMRPLEANLNEMREKIKRDNKAATALNQVKRVYKKDGGTFANLSKNFEGATVTVATNFMGRFIGYDVKIYGDCLAYIRIDNEIPTAEAVALIEKEIFAQIDRYKNNIEEAEKWLEKFPALYEEIMGGLVQSILKYATPTNDKGFFYRYLNYTIRDLLKNYHFSI